MNKLWHYFKKISFFKTIVFNFSHLPLKEAVKFPIIISPSAVVFPCNGKIKINSEIRTGMIKIGVSDIPLFTKKLGYKTLFRLGIDGYAQFQGSFSIYNGSKISSNGEIVFGNNFRITGQSMVICENKISFGNNFLMSWGGQICDTDFHQIKINSIEKKKSAPISIGDNVWLGANVYVNKGSKINDNSVVSSNTLVNKEFKKKNILIGGIPSKIICENIDWSY